MQSDLLVRSPTGLWYPREPRANVEYRAELSERAKEDPEQQAAYMELAHRDPVWWVASFCVTHDTRVRPPEIPFVPYSYQADLLMGLQESIHLGRDEHVSKSRDTGVTWCVLYVFDHFCIFEEGLHFLAVSRNEDYVDKPGNPKALFWRLDKNHQKLPAWMLPRIALDRPWRTFMHWENPRTHSILDGETTTTNLGVGDRRSGILLDEYPTLPDPEKIDQRTADVSPCRIRVGTPRGQVGRFWEIREQGNSVIREVSWEDHPKKSLGLYRVKAGEVELLDGYRGPALYREHDGSRRVVQFPEEWPFITDEDMVRSVWLDNEERRRGSRRELAEEVLINWRTSGVVFFDLKGIEEHRQWQQEPYARGDLDYAYDRDNGRVSQPVWNMDPVRPRWRLWVHLDPHGRPPQDRNYVIGGDIASGFGESQASNSVLSVWDCSTRQKVAEFADPHTSPEELARIAYAAGVWFAGPVGEAYHIWEANGPGTIYGGTLLRLGAWNVYYHRDETSERAKPGTRPGWWSSTAAREKLLGEYRRALNHSTVTNPCKEGLDEALRYVYTDAGDLVHQSVADKTTGAKMAHGDRVISDALGVRGLEEQPAVAGPHAPRLTGDTFAERRQRRQQMKGASDPWAP